MNKKTATIIGMAVLLCMSAAQAQVYKWVDAKGRTHYTDTPPPPEQVKTPVKVLGEDGRGSIDLPYQLAGPVRNYPVTLYTTTSCAACDSGRDLLKARGIPFSEKTVSTPEDHERLNQLGSNGQVPLLTVGPTKLIGFEEGAWNGALTDASYPVERMLPANYRNPQPEPAAPPRGPSPEQVARVKAAAEAKAAADAKAREPKPPADAPPGFIF
ncbi:MAG: glutaredoxin family protein [Pseudomonadota bacterium]